MEAWGRDQNVDGKVRMLADTNGAFTKAIDLEKDLSGPLGTVRCQRFSMLVENGVVKVLPEGVLCTPEGVNNCGERTENIYGGWKKGSANVGGTEDYMWVGVGVQTDCLQNPKNCDHCNLLDYWELT